MAGKQFPTQTLYMLRTPVIVAVFTPFILYKLNTDEMYAKNFDIAFRQTEGTYQKIFIFAMLQTVIPFNCLSYSLQYIEAGVGSVLMACMPLVTVAMKQIPWVKALEKNPKPLSVMNVVGMAVGLSGVLLCVLGNSNRQSNESMEMVMFGYLLYVCAVVSWAIAGIYWSHNKGELPLILCHE